MRKITLISQVTLDGVIQAPGGPTEDTSNGFSHGGWAANFIDPTFRAELEKIMACDFDLLLGRRTYDIWEAYWPHQDNSIAGAFNRATKYVATTTRNSFAWDKTVKLDGDVAQAVRMLKEGEGRDINIWGSGKLLQTLIAHGLIDEFRLWIFPIVVGEGKRLFEHGLPASAMKLVNSVTTETGLTYNTYRPAGELVTGDLSAE